MMQEFVRKSDVQTMLGMPPDILAEHICDLKGVWVSNNNPDVSNKEGTHPIIQKHIGVLKTLDNEGVMFLCYDAEQNVFYIRESCDEWFTHQLTKEDCIELSELFKELSDVIKN